MATVTVEVWVLVDEAGDYATGTTQAGALEKYQEDIGWDDAAPVATRWARVTLEVPLPATVQLVGTLPAEGTAHLSVA